jgi:hypothetical protein
VPDTTCHPLLQLSEEDLNMVTEFVLVSGSIKDLARRYGISYPTMRASSWRGPRRTPSATTWRTS